MSADGKRLLFVLVLIVIGMTVDYRSRVQPDVVADRQQGPYQMFCLPPNTVAAVGGAK